MKIDEDEDPLVDPMEYAEFYARYHIDPEALYFILVRNGVTKQNITVPLVSEILRLHFKGKA